MKKGGKGIVILLLLAIVVVILFVQCGYNNESFVSGPSTGTGATGATKGPAAGPAAAEKAHTTNNGTEIDSNASYDKSQLSSVLTAQVVIIKNTQKQVLQNYLKDVNTVYNQFDTFCEFMVTSISAMLTSLNLEKENTITDVQSLANYNNGLQKLLDNVIASIENAKKLYDLKKIDAKVYDPMIANFKSILANLNAVIPFGQIVPTAPAPSSKSGLASIPYETKRPDISVI